MTTRVQEFILASGMTGINEGVSMFLASKETALAKDIEMSKSDYISENELAYIYLDQKLSEITE